MVDQSNLTKSSTWIFKEPWNASYIIFLLFGVMMDILLVLIITRIISLILRNKIDKDYIQIHRNAPEFSVISFSTHESAEKTIEKSDELLIFRDPAHLSDKKTEALYSMTRKIAAMHEGQVSKTQDSRPPTVQSPPKDNDGEAEKSRLTTTKILSNNKMGKIEESHPTTAKIPSNANLGRTDESHLTLAKLPPKGITVKREASHLTTARTVSAKKIGKAEESHLTAARTPSAEKIGKAEELFLMISKTLPKDKIDYAKTLHHTATRPPPKRESCKQEKLQRTNAKIVTKDKLGKAEELRVIGKITPTDKENISEAISLTSRISPNYKTDSTKESQIMAAMDPYQIVIEKKDDILLSASVEMNRKTEVDRKSNEIPAAAKKAQRLKLEGESLSSEDYSALGLKAGTIPVPLNEYQRKLVAIAMRCKLKDMQEQNLKELQERRLRRQKRDVSPQAEVDRKMSDSKTIPSDQKASVDREFGNTVSVEDVRRESASEASKQSERKEDKKKVTVEVQQVSISADTDVKHQDVQESKYSSIISSMDKEMMEKYGTLSEVELIKEASSIVLSQYDLSDEKLTSRLEPIRRRWKFPKLPDGHSEQSETLSTGRQDQHSPWDPSVRTPIFRILNQTFKSERHSETLSSGTSKVKKSEIVTPAEGDKEIPTLSTGEEEQKEIIDEPATTGDESLEGKTISRVTSRRWYRRNIRIDQEESDEAPSKPQLSSTGQSLPSEASSEPEVADSRAVSPLYRMAVSRNRRRKRGIQMRVRLLEERAKVTSGDEADVDEVKQSKLSVSISSGSSSPGIPAVAHTEEVVRPDVEKPDVVKPDVEKPDVVKPDVEKPNPTSIGSSNSGHSEGEAIGSGDSATGTVVDKTLKSKRSQSPASSHLEEHSKEHPTSGTVSKVDEILRMTTPSPPSSQPYNNTGNKNPDAKRRSDIPEKSPTSSSQRKELNSSANSSDGQEEQVGTATKQKKSPSSNKATDFSKKSSSKTPDLKQAPSNNTRTKHSTVKIISAEGKGEKKRVARLPSSERNSMPERSRGEKNNAAVDIIQAENPPTCDDKCVGRVEYLEEKCDSGQQRPGISDDTFADFRKDSALTDYMVLESASWEEDDYDKVEYL